MRKALLSALASVLLGGNGAIAQDRPAPPVVIPEVKGNATTTRFGDEAITHGQGEQVSTRRFGSGAISRSSDGTTTTSQRFGSGTINRSSSGAATTTAKFGSGYLTSANGSSRAKDQTGVMVLPAPSSRQTNKSPNRRTPR